MQLNSSHQLQCTSSILQRFLVSFQLIDFFSPMNSNSEKNIRNFALIPHHLILSYFGWKSSFALKNFAFISNGIKAATAAAKTLNHYFYSLFSISLTFVHIYLSIVCSIGFEYIGFLHIHTHTQYMEL